eukprot:TRINITY_DN6173_c0_g1_i3.p1 TRINITY_DN6173_c0_g1~~TRINITY_DN6173_c0_g1_i3.p1  ORF type:complete len:394 (-),score=82.61 TRINITY_DN6173_c0_g1_i3:272-1453(-)
MDRSNKKARKPPSQSPGDSCAKLTVDLDEKLVLEHAKMSREMGPYAKDYEKLEDTDASHALLLHKMISLKADHSRLRKYISVMRPGAVLWRDAWNTHFCFRHPYQSLNLANKVGDKWLFNQLMKIVGHKIEMKEMTEAEEDIILGEFLPQVREVTGFCPYIAKQARLLHKAVGSIKKNSSIEIIKIMLRRFLPKVIGCKNVSNYFYLLELVHSRKNKELSEFMEVYCATIDLKKEPTREELEEQYLKIPSDVQNQGKLLHYAIRNQVPVDIIQTMVEKMSDEVLEFRQNLRNMDALAMAYHFRIEEKEKFLFLESEASKELNKPYRKKKFLPKGTLVRRGDDWPIVWGPDDDNRVGVVTYAEKHCFNVDWPNGRTNSCDFGYEGRYELRVVKE